MTASRPSSRTRIRRQSTRPGPSVGAVATDAELVTRVRQGDAAAFAELYKAHAGAVHTVVRDNVHDADSAADAVQEVFARALAKLDGLREPDRFRPWLLSIARHVGVDSRRHRNRVELLEDDEADAIPTPASRRGPDEIAELSELADLLEGGVATLSRRDATAIALVTHLGFGPTEVAGALGVTPNAAKVIVHRARRRLRDAVSLQVLVRSEGVGCGEFEKLCGQDDKVAAARHLKTCEVCASAADAEVHLFDAGNQPA